VSEKLKWAALGLVVGMLLAAMTAFWTSRRSPAPAVKTLDAPAVVREIQRLSDLVSVKYTVQKVVGLEERAFFMLGALLVSSVRRLHPLRTPVAFYVAALLTLNLFASGRAVLRYSVAVQDYVSAMRGLRPGANFVRLRYPTPDLPRLYGFNEIWRDPLFHLEAYAAVRCGCIDLSDYEAPNGVFPVVFSSRIDTNERYSLWSLEGPGDHTSETLAWLRSKLPIDYVVIVADESSPLREDREKLEAGLAQDMHVVQQARFIRVYERR
jgi:hypothetical protein